MITALFFGTGRKKKGGHTDPPLRGCVYEKFVGVGADLCVCPKGVEREDFRELKQVFYTVTVYSEQPW